MNKNCFLLFCIFLFSVGLCTSCLEVSNRQMVKEMAGDNYRELKRVLTHYRGQGGKRKAAIFLINNMGHAFSISPAAVAYREKVLSYVQKPNCDSVWFAVEDSHGGSGRKTCYDASIYDWQPVVKSRQKQEKVTFTNIGGEIAYLPVYYDENEEMIPLSNPFILSEKNEQKVLNPDSLHLQTMILRRKYVLYAHWLSRWSKMINARFEASDNPGFENAELLNIVREIPDGITGIKFTPTKAYRYIRIQVRKDARPDIAEMVFYGTDTQNKLKGELIYKDIELENVLKATDGDYTTHGGSRLEHYWFGLDLGEGNEEKVLSAEFCMRHDMNMVVAGDEYELFYYDYGWKSLGKQIPACDSLLYTAPSNAVFWLHNHTKGREERIFTYENGQQLWW